MINGHTQGAFLDDKRFWGIFECAEALGVPIYLHPSKPHPAVMGAYFAGYEELALAAWGFGIETGAHFLRLVFAGVFDAFPNLTFILGHLGEGLPLMLHRINDQTHLAAARRGLKKTPAQYLTENLVVTCSGNFSAAAFLCTVMALGVDNVLFSNCGGASGAKGGDQGECGPAKHVPDAEPGKRVTGAGTHTANICRYDPR
jgi:predicted TIM-barrel fold metal-dependent hydrolase